MAQWKYILTDLETSNSLEVLSSPIGWESVSITLSRSKTYGGIFQKVTSNLTFIKEAYTFLDSMYTTYGTLAKCSIDIYRYNNNTNGFDIVHTGLIDFDTKKESDKYNIYGRDISFTILDNDFSTKLFAREKESIPYDRLETLDGAAITPFANEYKDISIIGMEVIERAQSSLAHEHYTSDGSTRNVIFTIDSLSNRTIKPVIGRTYGGSESPITSIYTSDCFVFAAVAPVTVAFNSEFKFRLLAPETAINNNSEFRFKIIKARFHPTTGLIEYVYYPEILNDEFFDVGESDNITIEINETISLAINEGIYFHAYHYHSDITGSADSEIIASQSIGSEEPNPINISISEIADPTPCKIAMPMEISKRITESITGQQIVESDLFNRTDLGWISDGEFSLYGFTNGLLLRQFVPGNIPTIPGTKVAQLSFSWLSFFKSIESIWNIGCGLENGKFVIEDKKHFYNNSTLLAITNIEADSYERVLDLSVHYSSVEAGYMKAAYEEISGLEEYNNKTGLTTPLSNKENKLEIVSEIRGDGYGMEFARRKPIQSFGSEDTQYDGDNFILSLSRSGYTFVQNDNSDFETIENIDGITRPINLNITPMRNLKRWGWVLRSTLSFANIMTKVIKYNTSDVVSDLRTKRADEAFEVSECTDVSISELETPLFTGHHIMFNAPVTFEIFETIRANPYGVVYFRRPDGTTGSGWIEEVTNNPIDGKTNWKLIEKYPIEGTEMYLATEDNLYLTTESDLKIIV